MSKYDRRREEILNAAGAIINRHGLRDATLAVIASEIGLNLKSLRYYFERREDLVSAAFLRSIELHRRLAEDAMAGRDVEARVRKFVNSYFDLQASVRRGERPAFVHFGDIRALTDEYLELVGKAYVDFFRVTRRLFQTTDQMWPRDERSAKAHMLISQLLWSVVWLDNHTPEDFPRVAERLLDILLHGISARPVNLNVWIDAISDPPPASEGLSRESFLRTATHLINEEGYRGASVDRISSVLKVTKGAFYHYNETRDGLVVDCFDRTFEIVREAQDRAYSLNVDSLAHVGAAVVSLVRRQMRPEGALLRTSALTAIGIDHRLEMARRMSLLTLRFADMLNDGLLDGSVRVCDMRIASEMVTATINSAQELQRWIPSATRDTAADLYVRPLVYGLLTDRR
jgi:AcrR family transcriptional regulator